MLVLFSAGFWLFCWLRLRQTPWDADTLKVPRFFMCVYKYRKGAFDLHKVVYVYESRPIFVFNCDLYDIVRML